MRIEIEGKLLELDTNKIVQTKQINDLFNLNTRQTNYTNEFKVPRTPTNENIFDSLGIAGNTSIAPYIRNQCNMYSDSGECFVYNGWAVINSTDTHYNITIYDGNLDIYKAIEGLKLSDVPMPLLNHSKTPTNVANSMNGNLMYRYMVADFGGGVEVSNGAYNIDYLAPFAKVQYIWDCIFNHFGFTYSCSEFAGSRWTDLWLSYPKGTFNGEAPVLGLDGSNGFLNQWFPLSAPERYSFFNFNPTDITLNTVTSLGGQKYMVNETATYRFYVTYNVRKTSTGQGGVQIMTYLNKGNITNPNQSIIINENVFDSRTLTDNIEQNVTVSKLISLQAGDIISFIAQASGAFNVDLTNISLEMNGYNGEIIDFTESFIDWSIKDFFNEILFKFALTPYKDKFSNHYNFYTISELINKDNLIDWSSKFTVKERESYIYSNYAQNNLFKYRYDDEGVNYYDGSILVNNENLSAEITTIQSKTFAPDLLENGSLMYKLYDRQISNTGEISYKNLKGRFFFVNSNRGLVLTKKLASNFLPDIATTRVIYSPLFVNQQWENIINRYYQPIYRILNNAKVLTVQMRLTEYDLYDLDFTKPIHIKQLGSNYLINKVINYSPDKALTQVELIEVTLFNEEKDTPQPIISLPDGGNITRCLEEVNLNIDYITAEDIKKNLISVQPIGRVEITGSLLNGNLKALNAVAGDRINIIKNGIIQSSNIKFI